jgi:hypothetical protein
VRNKHKSTPSKRRPVVHSKPVLQLAPPHQHSAAVGRNRNRHDVKRRHRPAADSSGAAEPMNPSRLRQGVGAKEARNIEPPMNADDTMLDHLTRPIIGSG